jgi:GR25 family glycosyltransferase involved in LPS biosynthesis
MAADNLTLIRQRQGSLNMWHGYVINLARNPARWAALSAKLVASGAADRYQRFEAVDGAAVVSDYKTDLEPGALGCWLSHERVWGLGRAAPGHLHCLEDDAEPANGLVARLSAVLTHADAHLPDWDIIFTDVHVPIDVPTFRLLFEKVRSFRQDGVFSLVDLRPISFAGTNSYIVNRRAVERLARLARGRWADGVPLDLFFRRLVRGGTLRAYVTVPFLTGLAADSAASDVRGPLDRSRRVCDALRRGFVVDADLEAALVEMTSLTSTAKFDPLAALFAQAQAFALSEEWSPF